MAQDECSESVPHPQRLIQPYQYILISGSSYLNASLKKQIGMNFRWGEARETFYLFEKHKVLTYICTGTHGDCMERANLCDKFQIANSYLLNN